MSVEESKSAASAEQKTVDEMDSAVSTVCCRGANEALGHPAVYLSFADASEVACYYCGRIFRRNRRTRPDKDKV